MSLNFSSLRDAGSIKQYPSTKADGWESEKNTRKLENYKITKMLKITKKLQDGWKI